jgi:hypothetical protein
MGSLSEKELKEIGEKVLLLLDFEELVGFYWEIY